MNHHADGVTTIARAIAAHRAVTENLPIAWLALEIKRPERTAVAFFMMAERSIRGPLIPKLRAPTSPATTGTLLTRINP